MTGDGEGRRDGGPESEAIEPDGVAHDAGDAAPRAGGEAGEGGGAGDEAAGAGEEAAGAGDAASGEGGPDDPGGDRARLRALVERETAYGLFQRGTALLRRRHHAQAAVVLERAARLEQGKGSIVEALARAYYNSGQHEEAARVFRELLDIDPSTAYGHFGLGQALKQLGRRDEARTHLRLAVALAPASRLYRDALARLG